MQEQVAQLDRLARLRRFLSPKVADLIVGGKLDDPLATHRREVVGVAARIFAILHGELVEQSASSPLLSSSR